MAQRKDFKPRFGDVSIYHYANAKVSGRKGRITKAVTTAVIEVEKLTKVGDGLRWDQRQQRLDDGDAVEEFDAARTNASVDDERETSKSYLYLPMDIWFAIGDHIPPESVKVFASICRSTQKVTNSARFWFGLYKRCYHPPETQILPKRLQPTSMTVIQGLRASVIRSLYFVYPPFIERLKPRMGSECDLQPMVRRKCINTWYTVKGKTWTYWFKLKRINAREGCSLLSHANKKLLQMEKDMAANKEKDSKVLQVSCSQYLPLPAVYGLILRKALITVSQDMMANKLSLAFDNIDIVFDPALNIQILDWWHPQYPHAHEEGRRNFSFAVQDKDSNDAQMGLIIDHWYDQ